MGLLGRIVLLLESLADKHRISSYRKYIKGTNYRLGHKVYVAYPSQITIGSGSYINGGYIIASPNAKISIGKNCLLSYNIHIRTDMHNYKSADCLINKQGSTERDIIIEDDVWIGFGAQIAPGVTVKKGSVIGMGGILMHTTEEYGIYAGVPAKKIGTRKTI